MEAAPALADMPDHLDEMTTFITNDEDAAHMQASSYADLSATSSSKHRHVPVPILYDTGNPMLHTTASGNHGSTDSCSASHARRDGVFSSEACDNETEQVAIPRPLQLLDLPVDVLKEIVKEVTHTNDLTSLALTHSALHRLAVPHIYSRFDIVWPDSSAHSEPRSGVDALTYGLATLVMAEEIFGETNKRQQQQQNRFSRDGKSWASPLAVRRRRGNHYAQFTKKFSLGNGPADWVQEYLITKEGGKMLGTLVALAVARMRALETFVWDMPTGILRDVWLALSSLGERDGDDCRLEKVWVRFHNNAAADGLGSMPLPTLNLVPLPSPLGHAAVPPSLPLAQLHAIALDRVEHPSFSVLSPMKSLSVLEIDELAYLDEMAVLVGKSIAKLRELRVGMAAHVMTRKWVRVWDGAVQQIDPENPTISSLTIGEKRLGGVLGILTGFVHDMRVPKLHLSKRHKHKRPLPRATAAAPAVADETSYASSPNLLASAEQHDARLAESDPLASHIFSSTRDSSPHRHTIIQDNGNTQSLASPKSLRGYSPWAAGSPLPVSLPRDTTTDPSTVSPRGVDAPDQPPLSEAQDEPDFLTEASPPPLDHVLRLETLELERVPLSIPVLRLAFDWSTMTSLTLLNCQNHEQLWKTLRRDYAPRPKTPTYPQGRTRTPHARAPPRGKHARPSTAPADSATDWEYRLRLKRIHTDTVSPALIAFLKETLAPDSLEELFLQDVAGTASAVSGGGGGISIETIYQGPLRRHRNSLRRLLIDSAHHPSLATTDTPPTAAARANQWRAWVLTRPVLGFVCGGKMPALRELGVAVHYRDWHFLLQSLPAMAQLRSLYIPHIADHPHDMAQLLLHQQQQQQHHHHLNGAAGSVIGGAAGPGMVAGMSPGMDPRELAEQFVDVVALRPEVELCYMGISNKCFEILERRPGGRTGHGGGGGGRREVEDEDEDEDAAGQGQHLPGMIESEDHEEEEEEEEEEGGTESEGDVDDEEEEEGDDEDAASLTESTSSADDDDDDDEGAEVDSLCSSDLDDDREHDGRGRGVARLRLREILFYDDKVAIFKARHGRL